MKDPVHILQYLLIRAQWVDSLIFVSYFAIYDVEPKTLPHNVSQIL